MAAAKLLHDATTSAHDAVKTAVAVSKVARSVAKNVLVHQAKVGVECKIVYIVCVCSMCACSM